MDFFKNLKPYLNCKDHTVSGEDYSVMFNEEYKMLVTRPVPKNLSNYYKSEDYISHTDSKKTFFDKAYQAVKRIALKRKLRLINESLRLQNSLSRPEKNILDVGAGTGEFLKVCKNNSWNVFGTEPDNDARNIAAKKGIVLEEDVSKFSSISHKEAKNVNVPKVVINKNNKLIYMSRSLIPGAKKNSIKRNFFKQVCIYAFNKKELKKFYNFKKKFSKNETAEDIEILRFLELDIPIKMVKVSGSSIAVDIKSDIKKVEKKLKR